jgi:hypothetical protein
MIGIPVELSNAFMAAELRVLASKASNRNDIAFSAEVDAGSA